MAADTSVTFTPTAERHYSGYRVVGRGQRIDLTATYHGLLGVCVLVNPAESGFDRPALLGSEGTPTQFDPRRISVTETSLFCMRAEPGVTFFRTGFIVDLEAGIAPLLRTAVERTFAVTALAGELHFKTEVLRAELDADTWHWLDMLLPAAAAYALLDGLPPSDAIDAAFSGYKPGGREDAFRATAKDALSQYPLAAARARLP